MFACTLACVLRVCVLRVCPSVRACACVCVSGVSFLYLFVDKEGKGRNFNEFCSVPEGT